MREGPVCSRIRQFDRTIAKDGDAPPDDWEGGGNTPPSPDHRRKWYRKRDSCKSTRFAPSAERRPFPLMFESWPPRTLIWNRRWRRELFGGTCIFGSMY